MALVILEHTLVVLEHMEGSSHNVWKSASESRYPPPPHVLLLMCHEQLRTQRLEEEEEYC